VAKILDNCLSPIDDGFVGEFGRLQPGRVIGARSERIEQRHANERNERRATPQCILMSGRGTRKFSRMTFHCQRPFTSAFEAVAVAILDAQRPRHLAKSAALAVPLEGRFMAAMPNVLAGLRA
jgi:hypothetical protein